MSAALAAANSSGIQPDPTPTFTRPFERWSTVAISPASTPGERYGVSMMLMPMRTFDVLAASHGMSGIPWSHSPRADTGSAFGNCSIMPKEYCSSSRSDASGTTIRSSVHTFSPGELAARARSLLRRSGQPPAGARDPFVPTGNGVEIDRASRDVWIDGEPIDLAAKQFELLAYFIDHPRRACSRSELLSAVWSSESGWQNEATVTEHVYRLRLKIEPDPQRPRWIRTVRAFGYRWEG